MSLNQNEIRESLQSETLELHKNSNYRSTVSLSVGTGKTIVAIKRLEENFKKNKKCKLLFTGCRELYLENFKKELAKFKCEYLLKNLTLCCIQSLHIYNQIQFDCIIIDESHKHISLYLPFIENQFRLNPNIEILGLTGTPVSERNKYFSRLNDIIPICIKKSINNSVEIGLINDYKIILVPHRLSENLNIHVKTDKYDFKTSELKSYNSLIKKYNSVLEYGVSGFPKELMNLKFFFKNLKSKVDIINTIINNHKDDKILVYAGSIEQTKNYNYPAYHSKIESDIRKQLYNWFLKVKKGVLINVDAIKESLSIPHLNIGIISHLGSSDSNADQILGRFERLIPNKELGVLYILYAKNTIEEKWVNNAIKNLDKTKIEYEKRFY